METIHDLTLERFRPTADITERYYKGRKIALYGDSKDLREFLSKEYYIEVSLVVTGVKEKAGAKLIYIDDLKGKSDEYYIIVPFLKSDANIKKRLNSLGYIEFKDFVFTMHDKIVLPAGFGDYHDEYGNHIHCKGCKIALKEGAGNVSINIHDTVNFDNGSVINIRGSNVVVDIEEEVKILSLCTIMLLQNSSLIIKPKVLLSARAQFAIHVGESVFIGEGSTFSLEVKVYAGDGHTIFDVETGNRTNIPTLLKTGANSYSIEIQDHVWVGVRSTILNCSIGRSSIVGAGALVKGKFPNNCVIAGIPAKVVKKNVTWSRDPFCDNIFACGEENIEETRELE